MDSVWALRDWPCACFTHFPFTHQSHQYLHPVAVAQEWPSLHRCGLQFVTVASSWLGVEYSCMADAVVFMLGAPCAKPDVA